MSKLFYHVMQDSAGNLLLDVTGTMRISGTGTLATIYGDEALTIPIPNPMTNHPSFGSFKCFLTTGNYDFAMTKPGYTFETLGGVQGTGTMAQQDASAVNIAGGTATLAAATIGTLGVSGETTLTAELHGSTGTFSDNVQAKQFIIPDTPGVPLTGFNGTLTAGTNRWNLFMQGTAQNLLTGKTGLGGSPSAIGQVTLAYDKTTIHGLIVQPLNTDVSGQTALLFMNTGGTPVGSILTTAAATAYNTTSDTRLKRDVATLVGELAVIRALRPVRFRWLADDSEGVGFLAQEVAEHVQGVVTGAADAVDDEGQIVPQQIDYSKLVPWLVGAVQTLAGQVETLTERVQSLESALGV